MGKTLVNVWLTFVSCGFVFLNVVGTFYIMVTNVNAGPQYGFGFFAGNASWIVVMFLTGWGFWNRIWNKGK